MTEEERKQYDKERKHKWYEKKKEKIKAEKLKRYRSYDITFCAKRDCKDKECLRNQNNYDFSNLGNKPISISLFEECEHWKE